MSREELDEIYKNASAGELPNGDTRGTAILAGSLFSKSVAALARLLAWQGKVFDIFAPDAMRLWPTTPIIGRETLQQDDLNGHAVPAGTQVLILNGFNHRDGLGADRANRFSPDPWMNTRADYRFNHFSNGRQSCAGKDLALFIAKAVLANLLKEHDYCLIRPALDSDGPIPHAFN